MRVLLPLLLLLVASSCRLPARGLPACEQAAPAMRDLERDAEQLLAEGQAEAALVHLERVIAAEPGYFRALRAHQDALFALGRTAAAEEYARGLVRERGDAAAHALMARVSADQEEAARLLERALELDPAFSWAHLARGVAAARENRFRDAEESLSEALHDYPEFDAALLARAQVRDQLADFEGAAADYRAYLRSCGGDTQALYNLATILHRELHRPDEAEEQYRILLDIDEGMTEAVVGLAVCLTEQQKFEAASRLYESIQHQEPSALFNLGLLYQEHLGRPEDARRCFEEFIHWKGPRAENQSDADRLIYAPVRLAELERQLGGQEPRSREEE
ncbi:MAG: tetratricopeptide repeat protein [Planctomycetes bacterium]|nr:tetratricopeptide repeat protein [Planctomycetota bacterium]